jgi:hypothetical protein
MTTAITTLAVLESLLIQNTPLQKGSEKTRRMIAQNEVDVNGQKGVVSSE